MQINNNREMRALEDHRNKLRDDLDAASDLYAEAVKGFTLCSRDLKGFKCPAECGQCNGTGWVKK